MASVLTREVGKNGHSEKWRVKFNSETLFIHRNLQVHICYYVFKKNIHLPDIKIESAGGNPPLS